MSERITDRAREGVSEAIDKLLVFFDVEIVVIAVFTAAVTADVTDRLAVVVIAVSYFQEIFLVDYPVEGSRPAARIFPSEKAAGMRLTQNAANSICSVPVKQELHTAYPFAGKAAYSCKFGTKLPIGFENFFGFLLG